MRLAGSALRLTIFVGEFDKWHHKPLYTEIVHRAHKAGLAGATVLRGMEGLIGEGLVIVDPVEVIRYIGRGHEGTISCLLRHRLGAGPVAATQT